MLRNILLMCCLAAAQLQATYQSPCAWDPDYRAVRSAKINLYNASGGRVDKERAVEQLAEALGFYEQQVAEILGSQQLDAHYRLAMRVPSAPRGIREGTPQDPAHNMAALIKYARTGRFIDGAQEEMLTIHNLFGNAAKHYLRCWGAGGAVISRAVASERSQTLRRLRRPDSSDSD